MSQVQLERDGGVAVLTVHRPESRNAIALETMDSLHRSLDDLEQAPDVAALVIRGGGDRAFISGGDLKDLAVIRDEPGAIAMATRMRRLLDRVATFPAPVIAAINGSAIGGGAEVAVAADIRVAADDIRIGFTQVQLAIMPAWGGAERLAEIVGRSRALLLVGTGELISAQVAERYGLVDVLCERRAFDESWQSLAKQFAALPTGLARAVKAVISAARPHHHPQLEPSAVSAFARTWVSDAHWNAVAGSRVR